jgi:hypothetical protein
MRLVYDKNFKIAKTANDRRLQFVLIFAMLLATTLVVGCVSLSIGPKAASKSSGVTFDSPSGPFSALSDTKADGAWEDKKNGNVISYLSACGDSVDDTPLTESATETFSDLKDLKTIKAQATTFNGREAYDSEVEGSVEGVATRIRAMLFHKNGCLYTLTYVGLAPSFDTDRESFNTFLKSFHAP